MANNRKLARMESKGKSSTVSVDKRSMVVSTRFNGRNYTQHLTSEDIRSAYSKALASSKSF